MKIEEFLYLSHLAEKLKNNTRHSYTSSGRQESVAEHSFRLAVLAFFLQDEFQEADMDKVMKMCIFHDFGEAFTGDIPAFRKKETDREQERICVEEWLFSLPEFYQKELRPLFEEMEQQETLEARIYKALDKMEAVIQHNEADISTWLPLEYDLQLTYGEKETAFSTYFRELKKEVNRQTIEKIEVSRKNT